jgi:hypothetical protein
MPSPRRFPWMVAGPAPCTGRISFVERNRMRQPPCSLAPGRRACVPFRLRSRRPSAPAARPARRHSHRAVREHVEDIVAVMRVASEGLHGCRLRGLIAILWRAGLRIHEALGLGEADLDRRRGALVVRHGKGDRRRKVGMDEWAWEQLQPWLDGRPELPVGPVFCVINGPTRGRHWSTAAARAELRRTAAAAGVRHAHAPEMAHEGVPLIVIQRQLGHSNLGITRSTSKESTTPRSSTPSMLGPRPWLSSAPRSGCSAPRAKEQWPAMTAGRRPERHSTRVPIAPCLARDGGGPVAPPRTTTRLAPLRSGRGF